VPGGRSARQGRTVCGHQAEGPRPSSGQSVNRNRTTRNAPRNTNGPYPTHLLSESNLCHADGSRPPGGRSAKPLSSRKNLPNGLKGKSSSTCKEHEEHLDELHLTDGPPGTGTTARAWNQKSQTTYPSMDLPNGWSSWRKIWGRCEASLGYAMP
jgi:hypothetical protein